MLNIRRKSLTHHHQPDYTLDRLRVEQIVVTERYCRDSAQWQKMRGFWHPDDSKTKMKITWFNGTIDGYITGSKDMTQKSGLMTVKHFIHPVDVTSILMSYRLGPDDVSCWRSSALRGIWID